MEFDSYSDNDFESSAISMFDEDGNETNYHILATKKDGDTLYMLAEATIDGSAEPMAEVIIFKCVAESESDEMVFELVDEEHGSFQLAFSLFKEDLDALGIEY